MGPAKTVGLQKCEAVGFPAEAGADVKEAAADWLKGCLRDL